MPDINSILFLYNIRITASIALFRSQIFPTMTVGGIYHVELAQKRLNHNLVVVIIAVNARQMKQNQGNI